MLAIETLTKVLSVEPEACTSLMVDKKETSEANCVSDPTVVVWPALLAVLEISVLVVPVVVIEYGMVILTPGSWAVCIGEDDSKPMADMMKPAMFVLVGHAGPRGWPLACVSSSGLESVASKAAVLLWRATV